MCREVKEATTLPGAARFRLPAAIRLLGLLLTPLLITAPSCGAAERVPDTANYILGTQTIGAKYQFTEEPMLVETAKVILEMGSNILKFSLPKQGNLGDDVPASLLSGVQASQPVRAVLDMPFAYYFMWAYARSAGKWGDGFSQDEQDREYREVHDLTQYLLREYAGSGKTFFLGHWEGDWHLHPGYDAKQTPSETALGGMVAWLNTRQRAIDDAKRDTPHADVNVYHYTEVNLVQKGLRGEACLTTRVLPRVNVDYVSYSCYDSINLPGGPRAEDLHAALDLIESKLKPKAAIHGKRVFIGEFGFPLERTKTPEEQDRLARLTARAAIVWGCPFVLYWELYCNEIKDGKHRGFWLIDDQGVKQPYCHTLENYYRQCKQFLAAYRQAHEGAAPSLAVFQEFAASLLPPPETRNQ